MWVKISPWKSVEKNCRMNGLLKVNLTYTTKKNMRPLSRQQMIEWVLAYWKKIPAEIIQKSCKICALSFKNLIMPLNSKVLTNKLIVNKKATLGEHEKIDHLRMDQEKVSCLTTVPSNNTSLSKSGSWLYLSLVIIHHRLCQLIIDKAWFPYNRKMHAIAVCCQPFAISYLPSYLPWRVKQVQHFPGCYDSFRAA